MRFPVPPEEYIQPWPKVVAPVPPPATVRMPDEVAVKVNKPPVLVIFKPTERPLVVWEEVLNQMFPVWREPELWPIAVIPEVVAMQAPPIEKQPVFRLMPVPKVEVAVLEILMALDPVPRERMVPGVEVPSPTYPLFNIVKTEPVAPFVDEAMVKYGMLAVVEAWMEKSDRGDDVPMPTYPLLLTMNGVVVPEEVEEPIANIGWVEE